MPKPAPTPELALLFAALGEPTRLSVVDRLRDGSEQSIAAIATDLPISRQALSKHLKMLEAVGIANSRRLGRETVYRIDPSGLVAAEVFTGRPANVGVGGWLYTAATASLLLLPWLAFAAHRDPPRPRYTVSR